MREKSSIYSKATKGTAEREEASERGKRGFYYDKQVGKKVVTVFNCMLKGLWG